MMSGDTHGILDLVLAVCVFGLVLAMWAMAVVAWYGHRASRVRRLKERLGIPKHDAAQERTLRLWHEGREATTTVVRAAHWLSWHDRLNRLCESAGWDVPVRVLVLGVSGAAVLVFAVAVVLTGAISAALVVTVVMIVAFWLYFKHRFNQRLVLFERQFAEALATASRSLRAGHPLVGSFRLIAEEIPAPVGSLFGEICQQQALGMPLESAIERAAEASRSADMKLFATSVVIQLRSGGNLADMMDRLASVIRDRMRLARHVRVLLAQTQLSKRVLLALPFVLFTVLYIIHPGYLVPLYSTALGRIMLMVAVALLLLGILVMNRLVVLRY
ncbi:MAG: type II secretion system F family protein [Phycisphaerae bacterium]